MESWGGTKEKQAYTHVIFKNATFTFTWAFQRTNQGQDVSSKHVCVLFFVFLFFLTDDFSNRDSYEVITQIFWRKNLSFSLMCHHLAVEWIGIKMVFFSVCFFENKNVWNGITIYLWIVLHSDQIDCWNLKRKKKSNFVVIKKLTFKAFWDCERAGDFLPVRLNDLTFIQEPLPGVHLLFHYSDVSFYIMCVCTHSGLTHRISSLLFSLIELNPSVRKFHCLFQ